MRSLALLIEHHIYGQTGRYERFTANMAYILASGKHLDDKRSEPFSKQVEEMYQNPFKTMQKPMTVQETVEYIMNKLDGITEKE